MKTTCLRLKQLWRNDSGQDFVEYALMAALVATGTGIMLPLTMVPAISNVYSKIYYYLQTVGGAS